MLNRRHGGGCVLPSSRGIGQSIKMHLNKNLINEPTAAPRCPASKHSPDSPPSEAHPVRPRKAHDFLTFSGKCHFARRVRRPSIPARVLADGEFQGDEITRRNVQQAGRTTHQGFFVSL